MQPQPKWLPVQTEEKESCIHHFFDCAKDTSVKKLTSLAFLESLSMDLDHFKCDPPILKTLDFLSEYPLVDLVYTVCLFLIVDNFWLKIRTPCHQVCKHKNESVAAQGILSTLDCRYLILEKEPFRKAETEFINRLQYVTLFQGTSCGKILR